jgi:hypothetical protein
VFWWNKFLKNNAKTVSSFFYYFLKNYTDMIGYKDETRHRYLNAYMEGSTSIAIHPAALHAKPPLSKPDKILRDKAKELLDQAYPADDPGFQDYREEKLNLLIQFNDALPKERNVLRNSVKELIQELESALGIESTVKIEQRIG